MAQETVFSLSHIRRVFEQEDTLYGSELLYLCRALEVQQSELTALVKKDF